MNLVAVLSVITGIGVIVGIPASILLAKSAIRDGRRQQVDHDNQLEAKGFAAGVASVQAQLYDLKNQVIQLTDDRNYWRGRNGGGRDDRRDDDDRR